VLVNVVKPIIANGGSDRKEARRTPSRDQLLPAAAMTADRHHLGPGPFSCQFASQLRLADQLVRRLLNHLLTWFIM
jgi:hypothetical protein